MKNSKKFYLALVLAVSFFGTSLGISTSQACSSLGVGKHFGLVTAVNSAAGTFTIMDAETRKPIQFTASPELLEMIQKDDKIIMRYEADTAKDIQVQA